VIFDHGYSVFKLFAGLIIAFFADCIPTVNI